MGALAGNDLTRPGVPGARSDTFFINASRIFETARAAFEHGQTVSDIAFLIGSNGSMRLVAGSDWPLESLEAWHGAATAYRVSQQDRRLRLVGRAGSRTCLFEAVKPDGAARVLLATPSSYPVTNAASHATPSTHPAAA